MIKKVVCFLAALIIPGCKNNNEQVKKDVHTYLNQTYKESFEINKIKRLMNEGNGITNTYELLCTPKSDESLTFAAIAGYNASEKKYKVTFDKYRTLLVREVAKKQLQPLVEKHYDKFDMALSFVNSLATFQNEDITIHQPINYEALVKKAGKKWYSQLSFAIFENPEVNSEKHIDFIKDVYRFFAEKGHQQLSIAIAFYPANEYTQNTTYVKDIPNQLLAIYTNPQTITHRWRYELDQKGFSNLEATLKKLPEGIHMTPSKQ
ncbi:MAG: hypothetical protein ACPG5B_11040 [Chitinophagales bacterium]